jgi:hypothetical protein
MYFGGRFDFGYLLRDGDGGIYMSPRSPTGKEKTSIDHNFGLLA